MIQEWDFDTALHEARKVEQGNLDGDAIAISMSPDEVRGMLDLVYDTVLVEAIDEAQAKPFGDPDAVSYLIIRIKQ